MPTQKKMQRMRCKSGTSPPRWPQPASRGVAAAPHAAAAAQRPPRPSAPQPRRRLPAAAVPRPARGANPGQGWWGALAWQLVFEHFRMALFGRLTCGWRQLESRAVTLPQRFSGSFLARQHLNRRPGTPRGKCLPTSLPLFFFPFSFSSLPLFPISAVWGPSSSNNGHPSSVRCLFYLGWFEV